MGIKRLYIIVIELSCLIYGIFLWRTQRALSILSLASLFFIGMGWLTIDKFLRPYYSILPFIACLILCHAIMVSIKKQHYRLRLLLIGICLIYCMNQMLGNLYILYKNKSNTSVSTIRKALSKLPIESRFNVGGERFLWVLFPRLDWVRYNTLDRITKPTYFYSVSQNMTATSGLSHTQSVNALVMPKQTLPESATFEYSVHGLPYGGIHRYIIYPKQ